MNADEQTAATPGATLVAAREAAQLSVAEVARHLRLSVAQVEALEAGDFERLPGPVFVRGFIRNYARLVKLDPDAFLRQVETELSGLPHSPEAPPSKDIPFPPQRPSRWPVVGLIGVVVLAVLAFYEFYWTEQRAGLEAPGAAVPAKHAEPAAAKPERQAAESTPTPVAPVTETALSLPPAETDKPPAPVVATTPAAAPAPATVQPGAATPPAAEGEVHLQFSEKSWVEIQDRDGKIVFSHLNPQGSEKRISARAPLSIVIGNAHAVRLTYNGRPVDLAAHTKVGVARLVLE